jgi:WD40 repeat protein
LLAAGVLRTAAASKLTVAATLLLLCGGLLTVAGMAAQSSPSTGVSPPPTPAGIAGTPQPRLDADGDPLPQNAVFRLGSLRLRHAAGQPLRSVAFSPDGKLLASAGAGVIRLWAVGTGKLVRELPGSKDVLIPVAFASDGNLLAGAGPEGEVILWATASGRELRRPGGHSRHVWCLAFAPKGDRLLTGDGAEARLWDAATGKLLHVLEVGAEGVPAVAFSPDGRYVAAGTCHGTKFVWEADTGRRAQKLRGEGLSVNSLAFPPDSTALVCVLPTNAPVAAWDVATGKPLPPLFDSPDITLALAFSADSKLLATAEGSGRVHLWEWPARKERWQIAAHPSDVRALAFSPDSKTLASAAAEGAIRLWDVTTGRPQHSTLGHQECVSGVAYSADGSTIVTGAWDGTVRVWDAASGKERSVRAVAAAEGEERPGPWADQVRELCLSPDGKLLAVVRGDNQVGLWEMPLAKELFHRPGNCVAFSPDGRLIACGGRGATGAEANMGVIRLYERSTGKLVRELRGHLTPIGGLVFTPDGQRLLSRGQQLLRVGRGKPGENETEFLRVWDVSTGKLCRTCLAAHRDTNLVLSPDGRVLATFPEGAKAIGLMETTTGEQRAELRGHTAFVFPIAFAPDGRTLASGETDGSIRLWDVLTATEVARLEGHQHWVTNFAFSSDGRRLVSVSLDTTALVWDVSRWTQREHPRKPCTPNELRAAWEGLGGDTAKAYRAVSVLVGAAEQAVPFLAERVRPAVAPDANRVAQLLAELDDDRFPVREQAAQQLEKLGDLVADALRQALTRRPSPETKRRLQELLEKLEAGTLPPDGLRAVRVIEVLEHAGTSAARRLLTDLAGGAAKARLTREAEAALKRLASAPQSLGAR